MATKYSDMINKDESINEIADAFTNLLQCDENLSD